MAAAFICRRYVLNDDEISDTFDILDIDKDGCLSQVEIGVLLRTINIDPTKQELEIICSEIQTDDSGKVNKENFVNYMKSPPIHQFTVKELKKYFYQIDSDKDGLINKKEFFEILEKIANLNNKEIVEELFKMADVNSYGCLNFEEFYKIMQN